MILSLWEREMHPITCTEQQQDLHAQVLVIGHLQSDKLVTDLQHLLTLVVHEGQLHTLSGRKERKTARYTDQAESSVTHPVIQVSTTCSSGDASTTVRKETELKWVLMDFLNLTSTNSQPIFLSAS